MTKKIIYQEKYKKNTTINKKEVLRLISDNLDVINITMISRTKFDDKTESLIIDIVY